MSVPFTIEGTWPERKPGRFAATLQAEPDGCRCALLGLPDDLGVRLNGGRPGARGGPTALRAALARFGVPWDALRQRALSVPIYDAGDVTPAPGDDERALLETHTRVERAVAALQARGMVTVCVGGGHDLSLPSLWAVSGVRGGALGGVNLDAHLDVRERVGSGMPFRRLIDGGKVDARRFLELGVGRFANDAQDLAWLHAQGGTVVLAQTLLEEGFEPGAALARVSAAGDAFLSVDLDALDQSVAPGVSAPNPAGVPVGVAARLAEAAGACPRVRHFDLMELNPALDPDGRTARVACSLLLHFVAGLCQREP